MRLGRIALLFSLSLLFHVSGARAEQLPVKTYTTTDGLARNDVGCIKQDSRGFLWFCTGEGLSRFDGYHFVNYAAEQGLPGRNVNGLVESHDGVYFVATSDGLARFDPSSLQTLFTVYRPDTNAFARVFRAVVEDRAGVIWCGTNGGLYRFDRNVSGGRFTRANLVSLNPSGWGPVRALSIDRMGRLWVGTETEGILLISPDGVLITSTAQSHQSIKGANSLLEDHTGRMWMSTDLGLRYIDESEIGHGLVLKPPPGSLNHLYVSTMIETSDGHIWTGGNGITEFDPAAQFAAHAYGPAQGLSDTKITALFQDLSGNLWIGTDSGGAMKLVLNGFITYREADGLASARIAALFERRDGQLCAVVNGATFNSFASDHFKAVQPPMRRGAVGTWGWNQISFQDSGGDWWVASNALFRYPSAPDGGPAKRASAVYEFPDAESNGGVFRLYEDKQSNIWISLFSMSSVLARWDRATNQIVRFDNAELLRRGAPSAFREDRNGDLWIGFYQGGVARFRDGRFVFFDEDRGIGGGFVRDIFIDHEDRIWVATTLGGLNRIDNPSGDRPVIKRMTTADGLASNQITCFVEDGEGNLYVGTGRGLDRLDASTNHIRHYSRADGLPDDFVNVAFADRKGSLWFGTLHGLARLDPKPDPARNPPGIMIAGVRVGGTLRPVAQTGVTRLSGLEIAPNQNQLQIDFFSIEFTPGEVIRYQYQLEGVDHDWSPATTDRSVNYAQLASGSYRFLVRALNSEGSVSSTPAAINFRVLPPFWKRWWFFAVVVLFFAAPLMAISYYRGARRREQRRAESDLRAAREERFRELERVRRRIASDLHDDLGSSLTQISLLSEVVRQRLSREDEGVTQPLKMIAASSRELVDAMSDIVWAINPQKDHLSDLLQRMRSLASELFPAANIDFKFNAQPVGRDIPLGANLRREIFLVFKEALTNIVRHAGATAAEIDFRVVAGRISLAICDNGKGFDVAAENEGHGLLSMQNRAQEMAGSLRVDSSAGKGTTVTLVVSVSETEVDSPAAQNKPRPRRRITASLGS